MPSVDAAVELVDMELLRQDVCSLDAVSMSANSILDDFVMSWDKEFAEDENNQIIIRAAEDTGDQTCARRQPKRCAPARSIKKPSSLGLAGVVLKRKQTTIQGASTYERRKTEMMQLNHEAQELEARLGWLQEASQNDNYSSHLEVADNTRWKSVSKRQRSLRRESECENKKLRLAVSSQTKMARSLNQVLRRRVMQASFLKMSLPQSLPWRSLECSASEQLIYGSLLKEMSMMCPEIDRVVEKLQSKVEETSYGSFSQSKVLQAPDVQQPCLEFVRSEVVPFPRASVWQAMRTFSGENNVEMRRFAAEVFGAMDDIIMNKMQLSYSTPQGSGHLQLRTVIRHITHAKRSVFVAVRFYDNVHFEGQLVGGFVLHERKWTVLENDVDVCDATAACKATCIQAYSKVGPESTVLPMPTNWDCETLQNIVAPAWTMATSIAQRRIESILLAQATT